MKRNLEETSPDKRITQEGRFPQPPAAPRKKPRSNPNLSSDTSRFFLFGSKETIANRGINVIPPEEHVISAEEKRFSKLPCAPSKKPRPTDSLAFSVVVPPKRNAQRLIDFDLTPPEEYVLYFLKNDLENLNRLLGNKMLLNETKWDSLWQDVIAKLLPNTLCLLPKFLEDKHHSDLDNLAIRLSMESSSLDDYLHYQIAVHGASYYSWTLVKDLLENKKINEQIIHFALKENILFFNNIITSTFSKEILHNPIFNDSVEYASVQKIKQHFHTYIIKNIDELREELLTMMNQLPKNIQMKTIKECLESCSMAEHSDNQLHPDTFLKKLWLMAQEDLLQKKLLISQLCIADCSNQIAFALFQHLEENWGETFNPVSNNKDSLTNDMHEETDPVLGPVIF